MNNLNKQLNSGDVVVIDKKYFKSNYHKLYHRVLIIDGSGFGCSPSATGTAIWGEWLDQSEKCRQEGNWINVEETNSLPDLDLDELREILSQ